LLDKSVNAPCRFDSFPDHSTRVGVVSDDVAVKEEGEAELVLLGV
jgi:hypothetical protein